MMHGLHGPPLNQDWRISPLHTSILYDVGWALIPYPVDCLVPVINFGQIPVATDEQEKRKPMWTVLDNKVS